MNDEQKPCPRCGYCQTCRRSPAWPVWLSYPPYPDWPWWPWVAPQFIWYADPRGTQINTTSDTLNGITVTS